MKEQVHFWSLQQGEPEAVRAWVKAYAPGVQQVCRSYLGNGPDAAALAKDVFAQAAQALRAGYVPANMEDWLMGQARTRASQLLLARPSQPLPAQETAEFALQNAWAPGMIPRQAPAEPAMAAPAMPKEGQQPLFQEEIAAAPEEIEERAMPELPAPEAAATANVPEEAKPISRAAPAEKIPERRKKRPVQPTFDLLEEDEAADVPNLLEEEEEDLWGGEPPVRRPSGIKKAAGGLVILLLLVVILALLWALAGMLMGLGWVPVLDLGYGWFNANIYPFF